MSQLNVSKYTLPCIWRHDKRHVLPRFNRSCALLRDFYIIWETNSKSTAFWGVIPCNVVQVYLLPPSSGSNCVSWARISQASTLLLAGCRLRLLFHPKYGEDSTLHNDSSENLRHNEINLRYDGYFWIKFKKYHLLFLMNGMFMSNLIRTLVFLVIHLPWSRILIIKLFIIKL
jgi:hypothetical protein